MPEMVGTMDFYLNGEHIGELKQPIILEGQCRLMTVNFRKFRISYSDQAERQFRKQLKQHRNKYGHHRSVYP